MSLHISQSYRKDGSTVGVHLHDLKSVKAGYGSYGSAWVAFKDDAGNEVTLHVDSRLADMLAEAYAEYENWLSGQEGPTFDDALGAKCDAKSREAESLKLK